MQHLPLLVTVTLMTGHSLNDRTRQESLQRSALLVGTVMKSV